MGMKTIRNKINGAVLFEGRFSDLRSCVEAAVEDNIRLDYAELKGGNFVNARLDGALLNHADLQDAVLLGANLSEAFLNGASLVNAVLHSSCLCFSDLRGCDFRGALCGATDIAGAALDRSQFSTDSAMGLNFIDCASLEDCVYHEEPRTMARFSSPPLDISGLGMPVTILDRHIKIGALLLPFEKCFSSHIDSIDPRVRNFVRQHERILAALAAKRLHKCTWDEMSGKAA